MNALLLALLAVALLLIQALIGGTRMVYSLPTYGLIGFLAIATILLIRRKGVAPSAWSMGTFLLLMGYLAIRAHLSPVEYLARPELYLIVAAVAVYLLVALHLTDPRLRLWLVIILSVAALGHVWVGAIQFTQGNNWMALGFLRHDYGWRASGQYICPNHLAGLLEVLILFLISLVLWSRWRLTAKLVLAYLALVLLAGLVLTGSRGGYLSFLTGGFCLAAASVVTAFRLRIPKLWLFLTLGAVMIGLVAVGLFHAFQRSDDLLNRAERIISAQDARYALWAAALDQFQLNPVWGTGTNTYVYYGRLFRRPGLNQDPVYVHGDYLQLLAEYGLVGAGLFLIFLFTHLGNGIRAWLALLRRSSEKNELGSNALAVALGCLAAFACYMAHSVVDFNLNIPANALLMAAVAGMLANPGVQFGSTKTPARIVRGVGKMLLILLGALLIYWTTIKLPVEYHMEEARVALRDERPFAALREAEKGLRGDPTIPWLHYYSGRASRMLAEQYGAGPAREAFLEKAAEHFEEARALFPQDTGILLQLGMTLQELGRFDEAEPWLIKATEVDPQLFHVYHYLGYHYQIRQDWERAEQAYLQAEEIRGTSYARHRLREVRQHLPIREEP